MPPKKKLTDEEKKLQQYRKDVIDAMRKMKKGRLLLYDKGPRAKTIDMNNEEFQDFKQNLEISLELGDTPEEAALKLSAQALRLKIIEPHVTQLIRAEEKKQKAKEEQKVKEERDVKEEQKVKDEPEPSPVIDPPNRPLIDVKEEPSPVIDPPNRELIDEKKVPKTKEPTTLLADKSATKNALSQRKVRMKQKQQSVEEKEAIAKAAKQQGRDELIQEMKDGKFKPPPPETKLSPGLQVARDVIPTLASGAVGIAGGGTGIQKLTRGGVNYIMDWASSFFKSRPNTVTVNLPSVEYKLRPIPVGLTGFYKYMNTYTSIYNRLRPEEKKLLQEIDKKLLTLKQSQTRAPQNDKKIKNFYDKIKKTIEKMNSDIKDSKALTQDIKILEDQLDNTPNELKANIDSKQDNRLQLGLGQIMEMKRSGNFLPQLISSSAQTIPLLNTTEIVQSLNSAIQNITELEIGGVQRTGDEVKQIPQITSEEASKIKQVITGVVEPEKKVEPEPEKKIEPEPETKSEEPTLLADGSATKTEEKEPTEDIKSSRQRRLKRTMLEGAGGIVGTIAGTYGLSSLAENLKPLVYDTAKNIYNNIMETPIAMPETQAQSDQKISPATGTMRPRFIVPARDSVIPSMPKIRADDIQFSAFDYVPPGTEGGNGTARTNPLVLSQELEERLRYSNAGITISPGFGENVVNMILTESELKALLLPRGPDVSPVIYEFPIIDGDQSQNETKRYDQNLIQVEKFSPYNEYNDNDQLDEEVFGSILLSYVP